MPIDSETRVEEVMSEPLKTISATASVREAATVMREHDFNALFVPGAEAGILTSSDVVAVIAEERDPDDTPVAEVMTSPVERVTTGLELGEAATMMVTYDIKHLPVINDHGDYVGMVSSTDITTDFA